MKLLSFHPFSLYANGGGGRILRRLYHNREGQVTSLFVQSIVAKPQTGPIKEVIVNAEPATRWWVKWRLRPIITHLRTNTFKSLTIRRIQKAAANIPYDVLHIVNHGPFSAALCTDAFCRGKQLWVSFHDHYNTMFSSFEDTQTLWERADRRLVISDELGCEYQKLFGDKPFEIITDGVLANEISLPAKTIPQPVIIYFAGLLHMHYKPLFNMLADALDTLSAPGLSFKLILRGTQNLDFLNNRSFETVYQPLTLIDTELKDELDAASILYLPIKFTTPDFYLYSLSTKMVGYLGAPGAIFYHGPVDSAANNLLVKENAAICCGTLNAADIANSIMAILNGKHEVSINAKKLAAKQFDLEEIQARFWQHPHES